MSRNLIVIPGKKTSIETVGVETLQEFKQIINLYD